VPVLSLPDVELAYAVSGDGPPVTFLHGFTQRGAAWWETLDHLGPGFTAVLPDLRGHGGTRTAPAAPHTLEACAEDLARLWDALGIESTDLVGYSMGGRLALHLAASRPRRLRSLAVIGAHAGLPEAEREARRAADEELAAGIERDGVAAFAERWAAMPLFAGLQLRGPEFLARISETRRANRAEGLAASLRDMGAGAMAPVWDRLPDFDRPALVVVGEEDARYRELGARLAAALPRGRLEVVPDAGHAVHLEQPERFAELLRRFLRHPAG
jgi:2-succinyl-6-hydroxy-2,4-cyclohexadiene-1-carboxylate synthase